MADRFVRITLEQPYFTAPGTEDRMLGLRYGTEPARLISGGYVMDGVDGVAEAVPVSARLASMQQGGQPPRYLPGARIQYDLSWIDEEQRVAIIPDYVAMHYFGDWTILPGEGHAENAERTYPAEKRRIAMVWGGYKKEPRNIQIPNHWRSLRSIAPPNVPHVLINTLDSAQRTIPHFAYRPWDHFMWQNDCVNIADGNNEHVAPGQIVLTQDQLQAMIAEQVQKSMATLRETTRHVTKAS